MTMVHAFLGIGMMELISPGVTRKGICPFSLAPMRRARHMLDHDIMISKACFQRLLDLDI